MIRPVFDYCSVVYHSMLTDDHDERLERLQARALQCIYGSGISARKLRDLAELPTLRTRREDLCDKFVQKCLKNERYKDWFPLRGGVLAGTVNATWNRRHDVTGWRTRLFSILDED